MEQTERDPELAAFDSLVGDWATEATHPMFPSTVVSGRVTYEWLEGERFLFRMWRDEPGFSQGLEARLSDDGATLAGVWQLSRDDETWDDDLAITFTRAAEAGPR